MLDLNQGIYEHFLRRRGDNSTIRYGVLEDFGKTYQRTATRTNFNPPPGQSALAVLKRPTFTTTKKGQVAWRKSLVVVDMLPSDERSRYGVHVADRRNFVGRWSTVGTKTTIRIWSDSSECKYFIDRRSFFGQRQGAPGTFLQFRQTATRPPYERFLPRL